MVVLQNSSSETAIEYWKKKTTLHNILTKDLNLKIYKIQLALELKPVISQGYVWELGPAKKKDEDEDSFKNIPFSDEGILILDMSTNKTAG